MLSCLIKPNHLCSFNLKLKDSLFHYGLINQENQCISSTKTGGFMSQDRPFCVRHILPATWIRESKLPRCASAKILSIILRYENFKLPRKVSLYIFANCSQLMVVLDIFFSLYETNHITNSPLYLQCKHIAAVKRIQLSKMDTINNYVFQDFL